MGVPIAFPHQFLKPVPWVEFERLVEKPEADKHVRRLSTTSQLVALVTVGKFGN